MSKNSRRKRPHGIPMRPQAKQKMRFSNQKQVLQEAVRLIGSGDPVNVSRADRMLVNLGMADIEKRKFFIIGAYLMSCNICFGTDNLLKNTVLSTKAGGSFWSMLHYPILKVGVQYDGNMQWNWIKNDTTINVMAMQDFDFAWESRNQDALIDKTYGEYDVTWTFKGILKASRNGGQVQQFNGALILQDAINNSDVRQGDIFWKPLGMNSEEVTRRLIKAFNKEMPEKFPF